MSELTDLFNTNDKQLLKRELSRLAKNKDYKTINTLLRRNPNISSFDTRALNEEIPQQEKHFVKRNGVMKNETKPKTFKERLDESLKEFNNTNINARRINQPKGTGSIKPKTTSTNKTKQNTKK